eukprot:gene23356-61268_t
MDASDGSPQTGPLRRDWTPGDVPVQQPAVDPPPPEPPPPSAEPAQPARDGARQSTGQLGSRA